MPLTEFFKTDPNRLAVYSQRCGFPMTAAEAGLLLQSHADALLASGRIEIESGFPEALIEAFANSAFLVDIETLCRLTELFYHLKNITEDRIDDELLLARMTECFEDCRGSVELIADRLEGGFSCRS